MKVAEEGGEREKLLHSAERKLNLRLLPCMGLLSIICYIDRANLSFAAASMNEELGFTTATYGLGSGLFFIGYAVFQVPSNIALAHVGGPLWLSIICTCWGLVAGCFAAVNSKAAFLVLRMLLGIAEAGALPGMWYVNSCFYLPSRTAVPMTVTMAGITVAQVLGAPLAAGFLAMNGAAGMAGWRWLFLLEAIPAVLLGLVLWHILPRSIAAARFLTPEERDALLAAMAEAHATQDERSAAVPVEQPSSAQAEEGCPSADRKDSGVKELEQGGEEQPPEQPRKQPHAHRSLADDWRSLLVAMRSRVVWCAGVWRGLYALAVCGLQYFTPLIVKTIMGPGTSTVEITLLSTVPFAAAALFHVGNAMHSQHTGERRWHIAMPWLLGGVFMAVLPTVTQQSMQAGAISLLTLASMGVNGSDGPDVSWIASMLTTEENLLGLPFMNMITNVGGFVGPYIIGALHTASGNYDSSEWLMAGCIIFAGLLVLAFPTSWASTEHTQHHSTPPGPSDGRDAAQEGRTNAAGGTWRERRPARLLSGLAPGEAWLLCPEPVRARLLPELEADARKFGGGTAFKTLSLPAGLSWRRRRAAEVGESVPGPRMQRITTV